MEGSSAVAATPMVPFFMKFRLDTGLSFISNLL